MASNPVATLETIARMGYKEVEGFGYSEGKMFGIPIDEYMKVLKNNGLSMPSSHCGFSLSDYDQGQKTLSDKAKKAIDDAVKMGQRYIIFPWVSEQERGQVERLVRLVQAAAEYARKAGIRFGYHNHDFEYTQRGPDGRLMIEWLLHEVPASLLAMEMDIYWVVYAGHNPLDWFRLYPGRWELCHAKDLAATEKRETVEFGDGTIDFRGIFRQSAQAGLKHYIIELEHYRSTPLDGVKRARENFLKLS
jgi:Sugar phosphate isomerases/epimerases